MGSPWMASLLLAQHPTVRQFFHWRTLRGLSALSVQRWMFPALQSVMTVLHGGDPRTTVPSPDQRVRKTAHAIGTELPPSHHVARNPRRRESFVLKQERVDSLEHDGEVRPGVMRDRRRNVGAWDGSSGIVPNR